MPQNAGRKGSQGKWGGRRTSRLRGGLGTSVSERAGMKLAHPAQAQALPGPTSRTPEAWAGWNPGASGAAITACMCSSSGKVIETQVNPIL